MKVFCVGFRLEYMDKSIIFLVTRGQNKNRLKTSILEENKRGKDKKEKRD